MRLEVALIPLFLFASVTFASSVYVSYSGQFNLVTNSSLVYLPFSNSTAITSNSTFVFRNYTVTFEAPGIHFLTYRGPFPPSNFTLNEPFQANITLILPPGANVEYVSGDLRGFSANSSGIFLKFYGSYVQVLYQVPEAPLNLELFLVPALAASLGATGYLAYLLFGKAPVQNAPYEDLDPRDVSVLDAVEMGADTLSKIMDATGMPRTTAYRRVRKLVKLGYVQEVREGGKVRYIRAKKA
ncbi:transcriptional regulator [Sulfodiicoccus acidiphilus]|uniref:Transcriptional regulator n=1 Tax=Sulfodiicoccus acidiphilus TaxID=1670455 RepID=A0A348B6P0_9CREN|nr:winged helix-turn-helix domain-containing protein [Sulfodiicoccus acidiphilus]BBD73842.1 transcriptional regulator [Sulfodiicoccus acidiphilus]GGT96379.1 transcriptional regulator [Sulfodiicoccus acidiphilus]